MRIIIDLQDHKQRLSDAGSLFVQRSREELANTFPSEDWITVPKVQTKGLQSLVPEGIIKGRMIRKLNPNLIISTYPGDSSIKNYPQLLLITNRNSILSRKSISLSPSAKIITTSDYIRDELVSKGISKKENIYQVYPAPSIIETANDLQSLQELREQFTAGREFFLAPEPTEPGEWEALMKAFSIFKKWQQSELLLLLQNDSGTDSVFRAKLLGYKYREEVRIVNSQTALQLLPAAYAYISIVEEPIGIDLLNAFVNNIPVITRPENVFSADIRDALLLSAPQSDELAKELITIYKDERKRDSIINHARSITTHYSWAHTIRQWWDCIKEVQRN